MTANELAEASGLSAPTVVRFSKKIGFQSLTDFKITISTELQTGIDEGFSDIEANESFYSIKNKLGNNAQVAIKETVDILEEETIQKVVECLESAETVFLYGVGASSLVVEDILQKWSRVGKPIIFEKDIHVLLPQLVSNEKKKVLWLVSNSGRSADVVALAELAKSMNIEIIALTQFGNNPLSKIADVLVQTSRPKKKSRIEVQQLIHFWPNLLRSISFFISIWLKTKSLAKSEKNTRSNPRIFYGFEIKTLLFLYKFFRITKRSFPQINDPSKCFTT